MQRLDSGHKPISEQTAHCQVLLATCKWFTKLAQHTLIYCRSSLMLYNIARVTASGDTMMEQLHDRTQHQECHTESPSMLRMSKKEIACGTCPAICISHINIGALGPQLHDNCIMAQGCGMMQGGAPSMVHSIYVHSGSVAAQLSHNTGMPLMGSHVQGCQALHHAKHMSRMLSLGLVSCIYVVTGSIDVI